MILYVNGDSHTAAAEAVNAHAFAEDDPALNYMHRLPHPANLQVSWGRTLADLIKATFKCDAESAASNARIMRTSRTWLDGTTQRPAEILMIIQWSTWEREEWFIDGDYYQVNGSGIDSVPSEHEERYRQYIANLDWTAKQNQAHEEVWNFHLELLDRGVRHVFFNGNNWFDSKLQSPNRIWNHHFIGPYDQNCTFDQWLKSHGFETVAPNSWHFGREAHAAWSRFMLQYCINNRMI